MTVANETHRFSTLDPGAAAVIPLVTGASCAVVLDGEGRVTALSAPAAHGTAAGPAPEPVGTHYLALCEAAAAAGSECARDVARALGEVLAGRRDELTVEYCCRVQCEERWWSTRVVRLRGGGAARVLVAHEDVSERRATERALRRSEERHELVSRATNDVIWDWDLRTGALSWNDAVFHVFGYPATEPVSTIGWWHEHLHPDDRERVIAAVDAVIAAGGQMVSEEYRYRRGDGSYAAVVGRGYVSRDGGGVPVRMVGSMLDVTQRTRSEEELRRQALVFESLYDGVTLMDLDGRILDWNPAAERIFGFSRAEMLGRTPEAFHHPSLGGGLERAIRDTLARDGRWAGEVPFLRKDGRAGVADTIVVVQHDRAGRAVGLLGVNRDVTERRRIEEALRASEEQLRQAQKMEAVGRLAGGIAHDFNNLLAAIRINCELLLDELGPAHPGRSDAAEIRHAAARAASLTRQLLAFSRKQVMQPRVLDLNAVVAGVEQLLRRIIGEDVALGTVLDPALGCVRADPGQLEQVLVNLAVNARDAMPVGGRLTIRTSGAVLDDEAARQHGVSPGRYAVLAVSDTGLGMDDATRAHVFEPFFTTKEPGKGTGLGLSTVYGIVRQSGGSVEAASALGHGSTFRIYLPWVTGAAEGDDGRAAQAPLPCGTETVLVVEDEDAVRASVLRVLRRCGYTTVEARDGVEALRVCRGHGGAIGLVVTDIVMPEMGGRELAERLAAERPGTPVLFMSGYIDGALGRHGALAPGAAFVAKPFTMSALATAVREAIDGARR